MDNMMAELKTLKRVMEVPRLRAELKNYDMKGRDFQSFLKNVDELQYQVKAQLVTKSIIDADEEYLKDKAKREKLDL